MKYLALLILLVSCAPALEAPEAVIAPPVVIETPEELEAPVEQEIVAAAPLCSQGEPLAFAYQGRHVKSLAEVREILALEGYADMVALSDAELMALDNLVVGPDGLYSCVTRFSPDKCVLNPPLSCSEFFIRSDGVTLVIKNNGPPLSEVSVALGGCGSRHVGVLTEKAELAWKCPQEGRLEADLEVTYVLDEIPRQMIGRIEGIIE